MSNGTHEEPGKNLFALYRQHWKVAALFSVSYLTFMLLAEHFIPHPGTMFPATGIALGTLFFIGLEFWPLILVVSFIGSLLSGFPLIYLVVFPIAQTIQAVIGAYLLRRSNIDPLFRKSSDMFSLIATVLAVAIIHPALLSLAVWFDKTVFHTVITISPLSVRYTGTVLCLLILVPFILRWFAKIRFSRTPLEILETLIVFGVLVTIDACIFVFGVSTLIGIPLVYALLIPLFWIALRLRPRFVTLAMLITTVFAILSLYVGHAVPTPELFTARLFQMEEFLIVLSMIFFIIVSLEENRRLNSNLLRSQVVTLENAVARVQSESKSKNDFIAILAHELRNPLAPVVSAIDLLKLKYDKEDEDKEMFTMMEDRMHTVRRLLDDLLDISRISEGKIVLKKEPVNLDTILKRAMLSVDHYLVERHQSLSYLAPKETFYILGDPVRLEQIFVNLLTNASKFSRSGEKIILRVKQLGTEVEVTVTDTGEGIEEDSLDKIFTPFHQAEPGARNKKGLGIGLALVRSFTRMHDGDVYATSPGAGKGSSFVVTLPLIRNATTSATPQVTRKDSNFSTQNRGGGPSILVVDDNDAAAWGMGKLLELKGCAVSYAYDGEQAIEQAEKVNPDIILLDIGLPDQDGYAVAKTMRARGFRGKLIALTGYSTENARAKGMESGFEHYLIKPAGFEDLKRIIPEIA